MINSTVESKRKKQSKYLLKIIDYLLTLILSVKVVHGIIIYSNDFLVYQEE